MTGPESRFLSKQRSQNNNVTFVANLCYQISTLLWISLWINGINYD
jgi:hypothetical protein